MIHKTPIIEPGAQLADGVSVGAYSIVGKDVTIGERTWIGPHVTIEGRVKIGKDNKIHLSGVAVSMNGIELQDREFVAAIREKREPYSSVAQVLPAMRTLDMLEKSLL